MSGITITVAASPVSVAVEGAQGAAGSSGISFATNKPTLADADKIPLLDSAASDAPKHGLFSLVKSTLKTYFDSLYASAAQGALASTAVQPAALTAYTTLTGAETLTNKTLTNPTLTGYTESSVAIGTVTTTHTLSLASGTSQTVTLTASTACTFTMPAAAAGKSFILFVTQADPTGSGTASFTGVLWEGGTPPTITATAGAIDILSFSSDGTNWYGSAIQDFS